MSERDPTWDEIRRIADELELKIHLASMDARDRWRALQPRLAELEKTFTRTGERAGEVLSQELAAIGKMLQKLRDDLTSSKHA